MSERSSDIEFDFFDEPETEEASARARPRRRGPRPPVRPPAGLTPLLRLAGLFAFLITAAVVLVFVVQGCRRDAKEDAYAAYMGDVTTVARGSDSIGRRLTRVLTTPGIKQAEIETELRGLAERQEQGLARSVELEPPGALRAQHRHVEDALEFRVSGLRRLEDAFRRTAGARRPAGGAGALLAEQAQRFVASDVIWNDLFREPSMEILARQEIGGVDVPESRFLRNPDLATERRMSLILQRIRAAATGGRPGGKHGNGLVSVRALPEGKVLDPDADQNIVTATAELAFEVTIENSGGSQEVQVPVRLTIQQSPRPIVRTQTVDLIDPGERKTVVFRGLGGEAVQFTQRIPLRVQVLRVPGETNLANNSDTFQVLFTLPQP